MANDATHTSISVVLRSTLSTLILCGAAASSALLLYLSYRFEAVAYAQILGSLGARPLIPDGPLTVAEGFAAGLNTAKIALIYITAQLLVERRGWRAIFPRAVHLFLITISVVMTLLVIGGQTISPNAEVRLAYAQDTIENRFSAQVTNLKADAEARQEQVQRTIADEQSLLSNAHTSRLAELQQGIDEERNNVVAGEFYGARYQDYERNIALERAAFADRSDELLSRQQAAQSAIADDLASRIERLQAQRDEALSQVSLGSVFDLEEAQNAYLLRFLEIARFLAPDQIQIEIVLVTVVLSIILSLGVEISPILILGYVFREFGRPGPHSAMPDSGLQPQNNVPASPANDLEVKSHGEFEARKVLAS